MEKDKKINSENNYWKEAVDFAKAIQPADIQERFIKYCKERNFNRNEMQYLKVLVGQAIEFECTMAILKNDCNESVEKKKTE